MADIRDRLKGFLPKMKKANDELFEKMKESGVPSSLVIDIEGEQEDGDDKEEEAKKTVQVEFALGDFDEAGKYLESEEGDAEDDAEVQSEKEKSEVASKASASEVVFRAEPQEELLSVASTTRKRKET
jgi:hypothetical protein